MRQLLTRSFRLRCSILARGLMGLVAAAIVGTGGITAASAAKPDSIKFALRVNPAFSACVGKDARAVATVTRGRLNDTMVLKLKNFKPNLAFDLFTVQRSNLLPNGAVDPQFKGSFGLAWYQSDVRTNSTGDGTVTIRTILLDQIFGFDPDVDLDPVNTFHVGFWFNRPKDAAPCGFTGFTPFNGEHRAGPLAFITVPNVITRLGPLCSDPETFSMPPRCNP